MNSVYAISWSGGKDSALALHKVRAMGATVPYLLTMFSPSGMTKSHRIPRRIIQAHAQDLGMELVEGLATWDTYEDVFREKLFHLKNRGVTGCIFGDIDIPEHIQWCQDICSQVGLQAIHPLLGKTQDELFHEFLAAGFRSVILMVRQDKLAPHFLGRVLTTDMVAEFHELGISPAGEFGEYHTLVVDGPLFQQGLALDLSQPVILKDETCAFLDLTTKQD